jgi:hypothetical protein
VVDESPREEAAEESIIAQEVDETKIKYWQW